MSLSRRLAHLSLALPRILTLRGLVALVALAEAPQGQLRFKLLVAKTNIEPPTLCRAIDALESLGFAARRRLSGKHVVVEITRAGAEFVAGVRALLTDSPLPPHAAAQVDA